MPTLLDQFGNPIDLAAIREPQTEAAENRSSVSWMSREFARHPGRGLTPARLNAILQAAEEGDLLGQLDLADDMEERDGHLFAELSMRKDAVVNLDWSIEPPRNASAEEQALAEELQEWMEDLPDFEDGILRELLDGILKGFACIEMWWQLDGGRLVPRFAPRPQRWMTVDEVGSEIQLRTATGNGRGQPLRPWGWLLHRPRARSGYPARTGLLRVLAWPYLFKNYNQRDLAEFLEIYGLPLRIGKYPSGASDAEKRTLLQAVVNIGHNAAGIIPAGMALEFQSAAQGNEGPFKTMADWMEAIQSKVIRGQTLTSGEGKHGTQALGTVHEGQALIITKSDAKRLSITITEQLLRPLALLNKPGLDPRRLPRFVLDVPEPEDLALYADALPKLAAAGMRIGVEDMHKRLRIPMARDGEDQLRGAPAQPAPGGAVPTAGPAAAPAPAAGQRTPPTQPTQPTQPQQAGLAAELPAAPRDAIDELIDAATADWRPVMAPMVEPLLAELDRAIAAGESLAAFRARLPELIDQVDGRPHAERLARAAFLARLAGEAGVLPQD